jgi:hypothetical protein
MTENANIRLKIENNGFRLKIRQEMTNENADFRAQIFECK